MIKSDTTGFIESGGVYMERAADAAVESGMRATLRLFVIELFVVDNLGAGSHTGF